MSKVMKDPAIADVQVMFDGKSNRLIPPYVAYGIPHAKGEQTGFFAKQWSRNAGEKVLTSIFEGVWYTR